MWWRGSTPATTTARREPRRRFAPPRRGRSIPWTPRPSTTDGWEALLLDVGLAVGGRWTRPAHNARHQGGGAPTHHLDRSGRPQPVGPRSDHGLRLLPCSDPARRLDAKSGPAVR